MHALPHMMKALDPEKPGGPAILVPVERPVPAPGPGEILVRVAASGVNRPEIMQREGKYPPPPGAPSILGMELAGQVVAAGDAAGESLIGTNVCALVAGGAQAEYAIANVGHCLPVPEALSLIEAAALPETLFTVWHNVFQRGGAKAGETLLVHGGTSGIGTTAILLAKLFGIEVIVTAGSAAKCAAALRIGADQAIDYKTADFVEEVKRITGGRGVNVVLDMVGGDYLPRNMRCLAEEGRHVSIAVQGGAKATIPIFELMVRRLTLTGSTLRPRDTAFKSALCADIREKVWPFAERGELRPVIDRTFPLDRAADAHARVEAGDHVGKVVLTMD
ncbi:NAD(P)H-quinone oxidoreductase [Sphingomonas sp. BIUV-7]|uniref:NAD(P)H-quinone oxidoreductase n=1 Tax=Sphingomonas natans TaxID=3063330 RepID=A0ABT8YDC0_9SPHN|nr:NAD(P)H-quinone oxidoreductase [Sphingomonas sp. BIUV-7]MDO6416343.1 NAD(P)H-quinone oxidoreductase [Sphingomonas sp. BIUV-7]